MRVRGVHIRMEGTGVKSVNENKFQEQFILQIGY